GMKRREYLDAMRKYDKSGSFPATYYSFQKNGIVFVVLDGARDDAVTSQGYFSPANLKYLGDVAGAYPESPVVVFQHFPVLYPIASKSHEVTNRDEYLRTVTAHPNIKAIFAGHFHMAKIERGKNFVHITNPSLVQYPNAFRIVTMRRTSEGFVIDTSMVETRLKNIREMSRGGSPGAGLQAGRAVDTNVHMVVK
ncbi:MAG TPA: hypothetical protein PLQ76_05215, partial [bacterium]|nr:hypothetical protein [bacterium]